MLTQTMAPSEDVADLLFSVDRAINNDPNKLVLAIEALNARIDSDKALDDNMSIRLLESLSNILNSTKNANVLLSFSKCLCLVLKLDQSNGEVRAAAFERFFIHIMECIENCFNPTVAPALDLLVTYCECLDCLMTGNGGKQNIEAVFQSENWGPRIINLIESIPMIPSFSSQCSIFIMANRLLRYSKKSIKKGYEMMNQLKNVSAKMIKGISDAQDVVPYICNSIISMQESYHSGKLTGFKPTPPFSSVYSSIPVSSGGVFSIEASSIEIRSSDSTQTRIAFCEHLHLSLLGISSLVLHSVGEPPRRPRKPLAEITPEEGETITETIPWSNVMGLTLDDTRGTLTITTSPALGAESGPTDLVTQVTVEGYGSLAALLPRLLPPGLFLRVSTSRRGAPREIERNSREFLAATAAFSTAFTFSALPAKGKQGKEANQQQEDPDAALLRLQAEGAMLSSQLPLPPDETSRSRQEEDVTHAVQSAVEEPLKAPKCSKSADLLLQPGDAAPVQLPTMDELYSTLQSPPVAARNANSRATPAVTPIAKTPSAAIVDKSFEFDEEDDGPRDALRRKPKDGKGKEEKVEKRRSGNEDQGTVMKSASSKKKGASTDEPQMLDLSAIGLDKKGRAARAGSRRSYKEIEEDEDEEEEEEDENDDEKETSWKPTSSRKRSNEKNKPSSVTETPLDSQKAKKPSLLSTLLSPLQSGQQNSTIPQSTVKKTPTASSTTATTVNSATRGSASRNSNKKVDESAVKKGLSAFDFDEDDPAPPAGPSTTLPVSSSKTTSSASNSNSSSKKGARGKTLQVVGIQEKPAPRKQDSSESDEEGSDASNTPLRRPLSSRPAPAEAADSSAVSLPTPVGLFTPPGRGPNASHRTGDDPASIRTATKPHSRVEEDDEDEEEEELGKKRTFSSSPALDVSSKRKKVLELNAESPSIASFSFPSCDSSSDLGESPCSDTGDRSLLQGLLSTMEQSVVRVLSSAESRMSLARTRALGALELALQARGADAAAQLQKRLQGPGGAAGALASLAQRTAALEKKCRDIDRFNVAARAQLKQLADTLAEEAAAAEPAARRALEAVRNTSKSAQAAALAEFNERKAAAEKAVQDELRKSQKGDSTLGSQLKGLYDQLARLM